MRVVPSFVVLTLLIHVAGCSTGGADEKSVKKAGSLVAPDPGHYAEREHAGRIYVIGDPKTEEAFDKMPGLQISKTYIGAGPGGKTVVFEAKDKLPEMTDRLVEQFSAQHGVTLR